MFLAVTQINEPTLSFVPKFFGTALALVVLGPWLLRQLESFAIAILERLAGDVVVSIPAAPVTRGFNFAALRRQPAVARRRRRALS